LVGAELSCSVDDTAAVDSDQSVRAGSDCGNTPDIVSATAIVTAKPFGTVRFVVKAR